MKKVLTFGGMVIHLFIQQIFIKHLHVPGTDLGAGEVAVSKPEQNPGLRRVGIVLWEAENKQTKNSRSGG